tara:strand:+ start:2572 stop:2793 length:222 start_codon:yes stop_codon:yes gene_type:complete
MFWVWKLLGYSDKDVKYQKAIVGAYQLEKALEHFEKKEKKEVEGEETLSQKQKEQKKSYSQAVKAKGGGGGKK